MSHTYIIGASGSGKSTLLKTLALEAIQDGHAVLFIDPHGTDTVDLLHRVPKRRLTDTVLIDPTDTEYSFSWNPLADHTVEPLAASVLSDTIKDAWGYHDATTPVMDMYLYFTFATLLHCHKPFTDALPLLTDKDYRTVLEIKDTFLMSFWTTFDTMTPKEQRDATASTANKLWTLFADERIRSLFHDGNFSVQEAVDSQIVFAHLPQGALGLGKVKLLGSLLLGQYHLAALDRDTTTPLSIFVDEVHQFSASTIAEMLSGLRKYNVHITVAHQTISQLEPSLFSSLMGNCAERQVFRLAPEDIDHIHGSANNSGILALDELPPHRYRTYPYPAGRETKRTERLPKPTSADMFAHIQTHTHWNYCRKR